MASLLRDNKVLETLDLSNNNIKEEGGKALAQGLSLTMVEVVLENPEYDVDSIFRGEKRTLDPPPPVTYSSSCSCMTESPKRWWSMEHS